MSDVNYSFAAHIVNIVEGSNGNHEARGIWLNFPATKETVTEALEQIGLSANADDKQYSLDNFDAIYSEMNDMLKGTKNIDELNYLANRMSELDNLSDFVFQMTLAAGICKNAKDAINLTYNTECYNAVADMKSWENIGAYLAEKNGFDVSVIGDLSDYIDYAGYAKSYSEQTGGRFLEYENVYLEVGLADFTVKYDGNIENIPQQYKIMADNEKGVLKNMSDYIFKAFIVNSFEYDNGNKETSGAWLYFPTDAETVKRTFEEIGLPENASPDTYFFDDYVCGSDDLKKYLTMNESIDALNYLAMRISELEDIEMSVFQAVIQTKECQSIKDAINLTYNTECYDVISDMGSWENIGAYIAEREGFGIEVIGDLSNFIDYATYGRAYANDNGGYFVGDIYLEKNSTNATKKYNGNIENIPDEYRVTVPTEPQKMTVLIVPPMQEPYTKEIPTGLEALQKEVGGRIEVVYPFAEPVGLICNEEGKNEGMELNRALYDAEGNMYDIIAGTFVLAGLDGDSFGSLDKEQIKQFSERFAKPEMFMRIDGKIKAVEVKPSIKAKLDRLQKEQNNADKPQPQKKPPEETL